MMQGLSGMYYRELHITFKIWWVGLIPVITSLFYLFLFGLGMRGMIGEEICWNGKSVDYVLFLAPGVIAMGIIYIAQSIDWTFRNERDWGMLEEILSWPVSRSVYILVKVLSTITLSLFQAFLVLVIGLPILEWEFFAANIPLILLSITLGSICFCFLFVPFMMIIKSSNLLIGITTIILFPLMLCSSAFYSLDAETVPGWFKTVAYLNPMTYTVDILRAGIIGQVAYQEIVWEILVLLAFTAVLFGISLVSLKRVRL
jgi:ABC-2 type transport system permease protein